MIYTVTFNPSLDYIAGMERFVMGTVNRTETEYMLPGGKGINVTAVLKNLGHESTALGFIAGFTGREIRRRIREDGCREEFIELKEGWSRINVKLKAEEESEINGQGPAIREADLEALYETLGNIETGDFLVLAGSIPSSLPPTAYRDIMGKLEGRGVRIAVDATRDLLMNVLEYEPFLIKPNHHELGEIFRTTITGRDEAAFWARKLKELGAVNVLVSMAGEGAVLVDENGDIHKSGAPSGKVVNSVGAGDSMVAGFLAGYLETGDYEQAFRMGLAAGSASAFSENLAERTEVETILAAMAAQEG